MTGSENMKLGSLFGKPRTLASGKKQVPVKESKLAVEMEKKKRPGQFDIVWPKVEPQQVKDYQAILTVSDLKKYLERCIQTGKAGFDWETAASQEIRAHYKKAFEDIEEACAKGAIDEKEAEKRSESLEKAYLRTPLDPWKGEICTVSLSAAAHESRVVPISHKVGQVFEPSMDRDEARKLVLDLLDDYLFKNEKVLKIAVNLSFETKYAAKYGKYILGKVADPLIMWVRCLQIAAPQKINNPKKPTSGWGLKPATKHIFGVTMNDFSALLKKYKVNFFDEIDASKGEGLLYSAEDADYAVQHYEYWSQIAAQIPRYEEWL
ncbi:3'-5' exonuclease, partial [Bacillus thuringiensis]